ncbi:MAG: hypothetical protein BMS9Abin34_465 [Patescibacteria group bacterium]|nr:MAG: hypothetical protein BMS9Abin34_465 [Patescibacteria group bacterium]
MSVKKLFADKPQVVYSTSSAHSGLIRVWKHHDGLVLEVGGYPQSVSLGTSDLAERYWSKAVAEVGERLSGPRRALIIGVGGATILHLLTQRFSDLEIVGVELDPEIIDIARRFFSLDDINNLSVVEGDGAKYVLSCEGDRFDLTFVDAYLGGNFPLHFEEERFLRRLREITDPAGLVAINRASGFDRPSFEKLLGGVFAKVEVVKIPLPGFLGGWAGNLLYFCQ